MTDAFVGVHDGDGKADPGETIEYTAVIQNNGADPATGVTFSDIIDLNTTLVAGSLNVSPLAADDTYATIGNTLLEMGVTASGDPAVRVTGAAIDSLFDNDTEFLGDSFTLLSVEADTTAPFTTATEQGGSVTVETDGNFSYIPAVGFSGTDNFDYVITDDGPDNILGNADDLTGAGRVTITVSPETVWYVDNEAAPGGSGRSTDPFDTLVDAEAASSTNDTIYVFQGDGTTTGQNAGIILKDGQRLVGEGVALTVPVAVNGGSSPTTLKAAGTRPLVGNGVGNGVSVTTSSASFSGVEIRGLDISGTGAGSNAVDITTSSTFSGSFEIADNVISSAGAEGIDVNGGGSGTLTVNIHDNTVTATGNGIDIQRTAGNVIITAFDDNTVLGDTGGIGINVVGTGGSVLFDSDPDSNYDVVSGGNTFIGQSSNRVGGAGLRLSNVRGDLSFSDLDVYASGVALFVDGTTSNFVSSGTGTRVAANTNTPTLDANGGPAVDLTETAVNLVLASLTSTNSSTTGVSMLEVSGTFTAPSGSSITNATGTDFLVDGNLVSTASVSVSYGGTITDDIGTLVQIVDVTGGNPSYAFTGAISDGNDGDGSGITLSNNDNATIRFSGGLSLSTGSNPAFSATNGATAVEVCDENPCNPGSTGFAVNTLTTTNGTALNVANTNIGANNLEFRSISSNGATNGIVLNTTGSSGGLKVKGNGSSCTSAGTCTGGSIQNSAGDGVSLTSTNGVSLTRLFVGSTSNHGINTSAVNGLTLTSSYVTNAGNGDNEYGLNLVNPSGTVTIDGTTFNNAADNLVYATHTGPLTLNVSNSSSFSYPSSVSGTANSAILIEPSGAGAAAVSIQNSTFTNIVSASAQIGSNTAGANGTHNFTFSNNTISVTLASRGSGVVVSGQELTTTNITIDNNNFSGAGGNGVISIDTNDSSIVRGSASGNTIANPPGIGIFVAVDEAAKTDVTLNGNTITNSGGDGIQTVNFGGIGVSTMDITITNNQINGHSLNTAVNFVGGVSFTAFEDNSCVVLRNNTVLNTPAGPTQCGGAPCVDYYLEEVGGVATMEEVPNTGSTTTDTAYVNSINDAGPVTVFGTIDLTNGANCNITGLGLLPNNNLVLAQNQVETSPVIVAQVASTNLDSANTYTAAFTSWKLSEQTSENNLPNTVINASTGSGGKPLFTVQPVPALSGETVSVPAFTLPAGKSVTIKFQVTVNGPSLPLGTTQISNQATLSGSNFSNVQTDDPSAGGGSDPTITPVDRPDTTVTSINRTASSPTNAASVSWTVTFADAISGLTSSNFTLANSGLGGSPAITAVTPVGAAPATQWTVTAGAGTGDGTLGLNLTNDTSVSHDTTNLTFIGQVYTIERTPPTVTINSAAPNPTNTSPIPVTVQFSETVNNFIATDIVAGNATVGNFLAVDGDTYTFDLTPSGQGSVTADIAADVAIDAAGNDNTAATQFSRTFDDVGPTVTMDSAVSDPTNANPISVTAQFSETVDNFIATDIVAANAIVGNFTAVDGDTYTFDLTPSGQGLVTADIAAGVATDLVGNGNTAATQFSRTFDSDAPTVAITSVASDPTNTSPIPVTVQFSENMTGFAASDITPGNATVGNFNAVDGDTYTFDLTPSSQGVVTVDIAAAVAQDGSGNDNSAASQFSRTFDSDIPTVSMTSAAPDPTNTSSISVTAQFSENVTGFDGGDITAGNATVGNFVAVDGDTYSFDLTPLSAGLVTADITAGLAADPAGNGNSAATQFSRTFDSDAPTVTMSSAASDPTNSSPIPVTVQFSENVTGFDASDITTGNAAVGNFNVVDGDTYAFDLTPSGQGQVTADISAGVAQDSSSNGNSAAPQFSRTFDTLAPTVTINQASGQADPTNAPPLNFTVVFSDPVSGFATGDVDLSGTANATTAVVTGSGATYNVAVSGMTSSGTVVVSIPAGVAQDAATNTNAASISTDNTVSYIQDNTAPVVVSILRADPNPTSAVSVDFTVTFSEPVTGIDVGDFSLMTSGVSNTSVSAVNGSGNVYVVTVNTGSNNGSIRLDLVNNGTIEDTAFNSLTAGFTGETYTVIDKSAIFADVVFSHWANNYIERLYNADVTSGCGANPLIYCPDDRVTRAEIVVFILKSVHGSSYVPPNATGTIFNDVPVNHWAADWIEQLYAEGITSGCGNGNYCPEEGLTTRAQLAVFLLRGKYGASYVPPSANGVFNDVPVTHWAADWMEQLYAEGITSGCGNGNYCPESFLTRAQMAILLVRTFNLP